MENHFLDRDLAVLKTLAGFERTVVVRTEENVGY